MSCGRNIKRTYSFEDLFAVRKEAEVLRAQVLALTAERDHHKFHAENNAALRHRALADRDAMKAERDKLREERDALRRDTDRLNNLLKCYQIEVRTIGAIDRGLNNIVTELDGANARADAAEREVLYWKDIADGLA